MKTLLASIAAISLFAAPATAQERDRDRPHAEQRERVQSHDRERWRDRERKRIKRQRARSNWTFDIVVGPRQRYRDHRTERLCHRPFESYLTTYGAERRGRIIINGKRYRPRQAFCVRNLRRGDFIYHDLNNNRRHDRYEPYGYARWDRWPRRSGYRGNHFTVDLRR